jgi:DNA-binding IclR family transcriptional regulator
VAGESVAVSQLPRKDKSDYTIQSVANALDMLETVAASAEGVSFDGLRRQLALSRDTALKLSANLEQRGYLERNRLTGHYCLSLQTLKLSQTFIRQAALLTQARPIIEAANLKCGESVYIAVLKDTFSVYLEQAETRQAIRVVSRFGAHLPAYCSAGGKVLLAGLAPEELAAYLHRAEIDTYTPTTITDHGALEYHLRQITVQGYAINDEELESGVSGVAAPIRNHMGKVVAAAVISAPTMRVSPQRLRDELIPLVRDTADQIARNLGYTPESREEG